MQIVSVIYQFIAVLIALGGIIGGVYLFTQNVVLMGLAYIIGGAILAIMFYAISESIKLLTDIEYNTRKAIE